MKSEIIIAALSLSVAAHPSTAGVIVGGLGYPTVSCPDCGTLDEFGSLHHFNARRFVLHVGSSSSTNSLPLDRISISFTMDWFAQGTGGLCWAQMERGPSHLVGTLNRVDEWPIGSMVRGSYDFETFYYHLEGVNINAQKFQVGTQLGLNIICDPVDH